ncbi:MAG: beta-lactamase family protein, partial [Acidobacteria bacterium]|nr:beta-lactamase family protein [Acidobacteriota bacterium]
MNFSDNPRPNNSRRAALAALLFACLFVSNLAPARAQAPAQSPDPTAKIEEYMNAAARAENFNGSILVARRGGPVVSRGYGMADFEGRVPNTSKTRFRIGSLTKQFTAAAVLLLQERGKLSVQDSICK